MNTVVFVSACVALVIIALVAYIRYRLEKKTNDEKQRMKEYNEEESHDDVDELQELTAAAEDASVEVPNLEGILPSGRRFPTEEELFKMTREDIGSYELTDFGHLMHMAWQFWYYEDDDDTERSQRWHYILIMLNNVFDEKCR